MSESEDSGPGRREVAHRLFAAEFEDSEFSYSESDEERAPNYVVTPTGARVNRLFVVGVLTELEQVNDDVLRARIVDPTGPFVVYAGQYQPEALAFLEGATPPMFVAVTGKARTFEPEDGDRVFTSIRPESISEVDAETRDRWVVQAAEQTVDRVGRLASARTDGRSGEALRSALEAAGVQPSDAAGATLALDYYDTTGDYLRAVRKLALNAARVVAGEQDEAGSLSLSPGDGTDEPLSALTTLDLEAAAPSTTTGESEGTDTVEPSGGDEATAEPIPAESATETVEQGTQQSDTEEEPSKETEPESVGATTDTEPSTASTTDATSETETTTPAAPETETTTDAEPSTESTTPAASETEATTTTESGTADEGSSDTLGDFDSSGDVASETPDDTDAEDDEVGDFDTEFELDDDEREEIEQEYGTDFQSGTEVDDAGEADIETPDPEELAEAEAPDTADATADETATPAVEDDTAAADTETGADEDQTAAAGTDAADDAGGEDDDVDLEDAVMAVMTERNDGSGADREAVLTEVAEQYGADRDAVEDAIQDALMGGRCYEPEDGKLTPI